MTPTRIVNRLRTIYPSLTLGPPRCTRRLSLGHNAPSFAELGFSSASGLSKYQKTAINGGYLIFGDPTGIIHFVHPQGAVSLCSTLASLRFAPNPERCSNREVVGKIKKIRTRRMFFILATPRGFEPRLPP